MQELFSEIGRRFRIPGTVSSHAVVKNGNINRTYRVSYDTGKSYIFQKVNTEVFSRPAEMMENIDRVTAHIRKKSGGRPCLHFHHTDTGENYAAASDGGFWRVMNFIDSVTVTPEQSVMKKTRMRSVTLWIACTICPARSFSRESAHSAA